MVAYHPRDNKNKRIMKKEYIKPEMMVEQFMAEVAFMIGSGEHEGNITGEDGKGDTSDFNSNHHRGSWGNLWD